jgi:PAS domain S-box-containing protein
MEAQPVESDAASARDERLAELLTLSYEPMFVWRLDGAIENWNAVAERFYGFSREEAVGRNVSGVRPPHFERLRAVA